VDKRDQKEIIKIFAVVLQAACKKYQVKLYHFVLMATHYHLLLSTPLANLNSFMQYVNARVAERMNKRDKTTGHLWGGRYFSAIIQTLTHHLNVIRYIYQNPLRAKKVTNLIDYEESTFQIYAFGKDVYVTITEDEVLVVFGKTEKEKREEFIRFVLGEELEQKTVDEIRQAFRSGFLGSDDFKTQMKEKYLKPKSGITESETSDHH